MVPAAVCFFTAALIRSGLCALTSPPLAYRAVWVMMGPILPDSYFHPREGIVRPRIEVNPSTEHALFLKLFVTNSGGW